MADESTTEENKPAAAPAVESPASAEGKQVDKKLIADTANANMRVKVYAPFKVYFDGDAHSISAVNDTGEFDILPQHHNFMTLISAGDITIRTDRGEEKIKITHGIMHVKADEVKVFLDV